MDLGHLVRPVIARPLALAWLLLVAAACAPPPQGEVRLRITDAATGRPIPARLEWRLPDGSFLVPEAALDLTFECVTAPPDGGVEPEKALENPHTGTTQFYAGAPVSFLTSVGRHRLRVFRGNEWLVAEREVDVSHDGIVEVEVALRRWADESARGWSSADDHLHITRRTAAEEERIGLWMQAEDLRVANLLQMGTHAQHSVTPQRAFGPAGAARFGETLLVSGQEHPRTHFFGHTITLGARERVDLREEYALYERFFARGRELGGATGFAHWGMGVARRGLALTAPKGLVDFVEVLSFEFANPTVWYELMDLGFRVAPTAGTDFPCGPWSIPGRERMYVRTEGPVTPESFALAVRKGRTYVTNGPLLELAVGSAGIGDELRLPAPGSVRVHGVVRFDPARDRPETLTLVVGGLDHPLDATPTAPGVLAFDRSLALDRTTWVALRVDGEKVGEAPVPLLDIPQWLLALSRKLGDGAQGFDEREAFLVQHQTARSSAHSGAVWVEVAGSPPLLAQARGRQLAAEWTALLEDVRERLNDENLPEQGIWDWVPYSDGLPTSQLRQHRPRLLEAIREAEEQLTPPAE